MSERTSKETSVTSSTNLPNNYQLQVAPEPSVPAPKELVSSVPPQNLEYTAATVTTSAEGVVLVVNVGSVPKNDFIRELNAKIEGSIRSRGTISSAT